MRESEKKNREIERERERVNKRQNREIKWDIEEWKKWEREKENERERESVCAKGRMYKKWLGPAAAARRPQELLFLFLFLVEALRLLLTKPPTFMKMAQQQWKIFRMKSVACVVNNNELKNYRYVPRYLPTGWAMLSPIWKWSNLK